MNRDQIIALAVENGAKLYTEPPMRAVTGVSMSFEQLHTFAELIVRECAAVALREDHDPHECILKHFGVKS
jgi:hypothetical protein